jgi:NADPH:quinone reductase-like Zn-dependent oxidoreductase
MKSVRIKGYGSTSDVIEIDQNTPAPNDPSEGKVLVKVKAAGVNPTDWKISEGYMQQIMPIEFPATLGWDFSGTVEKAGAGLSDIK